MDTELVTLIAACVAAVAAVAGLVVQVRIARSREGREAWRRLLEPHLPALAEALHGVVACADACARAKSDESRAKWRGRASRAQAALDELRARLRYPLWGLDEGLRTLRRLPNWVENARGHARHEERLLERGDRLRRALDGAVSAAYARGRPPTLPRRWRVERRAQALRGAFEALIAEKRVAREARLARPAPRAWRARQDSNLGPSD